MRKLWILIAVVPTATVAVFWAVGSYLIRPAGAQLGPAPVGATAVSFSSGSGSTLRGWFFPVEGSSGAAVLMHGFRNNRGSMTARAKLMNRNGFSALTFDFQAHGESEGEHITFGYRESLDAQAAVRYLREKVPDGPVYVVGVSLGGAAALLSVPPLRVEGIILEAVFPDISTAISNRLSMWLPLGSLVTPLFTAQFGPRFGIPASRLTPVRSVANVRVPVLVLSGSRDQRTTVEDTHRLYNAFPGPKRLVVFEGAAHVDFMAYDPMLYVAEVEAFLAMHRSHSAGVPATGSSGSDASPVQGRRMAVEQGTQGDALKRVP